MPPDGQLPGAFRQPPDASQVYSALPLNSGTGFEAATTVDFRGNVAALMAIFCDLRAKRGCRRLDRNGA